MTSIRMSPNSREVIGAISTITSKQEYLKSTNGALNVSGSFSLTGQAIPASGLTTAVAVQIVDGSGNQVTSFGGGTQYTDGGVPPAHPIGNTIEWSDGANWQTVSTTKPLPVTAVQSGTWNIGTVTAVTAITNPLPAGTNVIGHVITDTGSTTAVTGTVTISGSVTQGTSPWVVGQSTASNLNTTAQITDGTNIANTLKSDGTAAGQNAQLVAGAYQEKGSLSAGSLNADLVASLDVSNYKWASLQVTGAFSGTLTFQSSNDNSNFLSTGVQINTQQLSSSLVTTTTTTGMFVIPINFRYLRVRMTSYVSGTANGTLELYANPGSVNITGASQISVQGIKTNNNAAPGATNMGVLPGLANAAQPSWTEGDQVVESVDLKGNQRIRISDAAGNDRGANVNVSNQLSVSVDGTNTVTQSGTWTVGSNSATGSAVPANAFYQGNLGSTALPTAGSNGNLVGTMSDKFGRPVVLNNAIRDILGTQTTTITNNAETTIITATASIFNDLVSVFIANTSATAVSVAIKDTTSGTTIFTLFIPAGDMRGLSLTTPWPQTSVNTNWTATASTGVSSLIVSALFIKNK